MSDDEPDASALPRYHFEMIAAHHDYSRFRSGNTFVDMFLDKALDQTQHDLSRTFVLLDRQADNPNAVVGFFTLQGDLLYSTEEQFGQDSVPVVELHRLARHQDYRGKGLGIFLLIEALFHVAESARWVGLAGVHLAFTSEGERLYKSVGFGEHPYGQDNLLLSIANVRQLVGYKETT